MAFYYDLVAMKYDSKDSSYAVVSNSQCEILNIDRKLLNNVSENNLYLDQAIVVTKQAFSEYVSESNSKASDWYRKLPEIASLIMIVSREWESGLN